MSVPTQINDHAVRARARLTQQWKTSTNILALLDAISEQVQAAEDALYPLLLLTDIDTMTGDALEQIGELVNEPRNGATDADYRVAIRSKIALICGSGTPDNLLDAFERITASVAMYLWEGVAHVGIWGDAATYPAGTTSRMSEAAPGGVLFSSMWEWETIAGESMETIAGDQLYLLAESE